MRTIKTVLKQLTNAHSITQDMKDILREIDPEFLNEEVKFLQAAAALERELGTSISPSASEYLSALEEEYTSAVVYFSWQGLMLNLKIFDNPVNTLLLKADYEDLLRENRLSVIPTVKKARRTINTFYDALKEFPENISSLIETISDFYAYLENTGYKLAHYFGFRLGDSFLYHVIPGYTDDSVNTSLYTMRLRDYLRVDLERME